MRVTQDTRLCSGTGSEHGSARVRLANGESYAAALKVQTCFEQGFVLTCVLNRASTSATLAVGTCNGAGDNS